MTEPVRWYEAVNNGDDRRAFFGELVNIARKDHPGEEFGAHFPRLEKLIKAHGESLDGRPTWVRIVSEMIDMDTVEVKQQQPDGTDKFFMLTAEESRSLVRP